jgi:hypothetical protein
LKFKKSQIPKKLSMEYTVEPTRLISNKLKESVGKNANSEQESLLFRIFFKKEPNKYSQNFFYMVK